MVATTRESQGTFRLSLRTGERVAVEQVVQAYLPQVHRAARGAGFSLEGADDIC